MIIFTLTSLSVESLMEGSPWAAEVNHKNHMGHCQTDHMHSKEAIALLIDSCSTEAVCYLYIACDHVEEREEEIVEVNPV